MSQFEYVSVAIALVSALAVGRLLAGFSPALAESRRYWLHIAWLVALLFVCVTLWWGLWGVRQISWTPFRFFWVLSMPGLLFVQAAVLLGDEPARVESFRVHYFDHRIPFFSLLLASAVVLGFNPWVFGFVPWLAPAPFHPVAAVLGGLSVAGLAFKSPAVHAILVAIVLLASAASLVVAPPITPAA